MAKPVVEIAMSSVPQLPRGWLVWESWDMGMGCFDVLMGKQELWCCPAVIMNRHNIF